MTRTFLYVDGENFAIRAAALDSELRGDPERTSILRRRANFYGMQWESANAKELALIWLPEPHRDAVGDQRRLDGILYVKDELYWDPLGLVIALGSISPMNRALNEIGIERAYYFGSASQDRAAQHRLDLHALGFTPNISQRVKPDAWTKEMAAQGITVVSRPKPVDILIATQVLEDCAANNFDHCIFVGGDEDYVPLLEAVRRHGKRVSLVVIERWLAKDQKLRFACDRFVAYDPVLSVRPLPLPSPPSEG